MLSPPCCTAYYACNNTIYMKISPENYLPLTKPELRNNSKRYLTNDEIFCIIPLYNKIL